MITKETCIDFLLAIEPEFRQALESHLSTRGSESNLHAQISEFSYFIENKISSGKYQNAPILFEKIEFLLTDENADQEVQNAICTCFLENLINYFSDQPSRFEVFIPLLGPKSREFCKGWDEFTGVETPGLWSTEKPNLRTKRPQIDDSEALAIIRALKSSAITTSAEVDQKIRFIEMVFPGISNLIFYDRRNLTPEEILQEAKEKVANPD